MILKNLMRRKGRMILTVLGISVGVAAIVGLGALANGLAAGYDSFLTGSKSDLILSSPDAFDISMSTVDESIGNDLESMSEVLAVSGMLEGIVQAEEIPLFFVFGYPKDSYILGRFKIIEGVSLVKSYRGQFNTILTNKSPDELIQILREKTSEA